MAGVAGAIVGYRLGLARAAEARAQESSGSGELRGALFPHHYPRQPDPSTSLFGPPHQRVAAVSSDGFGGGLTKLAPAEHEAAQARYNLLLSLPTTIYRQAADSEFDGECAVCLQAFLDGDKLKTMPCHPTHTFHARCLRKAFERESLCPVCRFDCARSVSLQRSPAGSSEQRRSSRMQEVSPEGCRRLDEL